MPVLQLAISALRRSILFLAHAFNYRLVSDVSKWLHTACISRW